MLPLCTTHPRLSELQEHRVWTGLGGTCLRAAAGELGSGPGAALSCSVTVGSALWGPSPPGLSIPFPVPSPGGPCHALSLPCSPRTPRFWPSLWVRISLSGAYDGLRREGLDGIWEGGMKCFRPDSFLVPRLSSASVSLLHD